MSDLDPNFDDGGKKPVQSPIMADDGSLDLPTLSQEIEKRARKRRWLIGFFKFFGFLIVLCLMVGLIAVVGAYLYCKPRYDLAQEFDLEQLNELEVASRIVDRSGQELGRIFVQNRRPISIDEVSPHFINALIAAEDGNFYKHDGVDYKGVLRAIYQNLKTKEANQGASTITQQLARNTFELRDRTVSRKVTEAFLARRIEEELGDKQQVLQLYVNRIYFGSGYYGIAAAAEGYFGKEAKNLTIVEAATLAGVIRNPYYRSPRKFPDACRKTRDDVLGLMEKANYIDSKTMKRAKSTPVRAVDRTSLTGESGYLYKKVRDEVIELLGSEKVSSGGYVITTTINNDLQTLATNSLEDQLRMVEENETYKGETLAQYKQKKAAFREAGDSTAILAAPKYLQGALLMIDNKTGAVIAQVGGRDFGDSQFDRSILGRYPPGTAFKPFVYAAAFEKGFFPGTLVSDAPINNKMVMIGGIKGILGEWGTEDPDNYYDNRITARQALAMGKNAATIRIGMDTSLSDIVGVAERAGIKFGSKKQFNGTMLGGFSHIKTSLNQMALAYSSFPNGGKRVPKTYIISSIRDSQGNIEHEPSVIEVGDKGTIDVVDAFTAHQINSVLSEAIKTGTGRKAHERYGLGEYPVAGKTGTEYNYTDNWFAGYTSEVTCVVWMGFDNRKRIYDRAFSSDTVLPVWTKVMNAAEQVTDARPFEPPPNAEKEEICTFSGELACEECFRTVTGSDGFKTQVRSTYLEFLRPGTDLSSVCHIHARGGRLRDLRSRDSYSNFLPTNANRVIHATMADPVLPKAPTIVGNDPYGAVKSDLYTPEIQAAPVTGEDGKVVPQDLGLDKHGLPIERPKMDMNAALSPSRVKLDHPRPINFDDF